MKPLMIRQNSCSEVAKPLFEKNEQWRNAKIKHCSDFFKTLAKAQTPKYLWIGCSDSREPAAEIVGLGPGDLFVHRNISNLIYANDMNMLSVLEYAVVELNVPHIILCGHYGCGGVKCALEDAHQTAGTSVVDHWLTPIVDLYREHQQDLNQYTIPKELNNRLCELNVLQQVHNLAATPIIKNAWAQGKALTLHGWIYGLEDGLLHELCPPITAYHDIGHDWACCK